jgi:predicted transcriptional regulator
MSANVQTGKIITDAIAEDITRVEELSYELKINQVMTSNIHVIKPEVSMEEVADLFRSSRISGAPVVVDGQLIGILSIEDLIRSLRDANISAPVSK